VERRGAGSGGILPRRYSYTPESRLGADQSIEVNILASAKPADSPGTYGIAGDVNEPRDIVFDRTIKMRD
jgi:hypothetical protein